MPDDCTKRVRNLYGWEIEEITPIFGTTLKYDRVRVHECTLWTDWIDRLGRRLKGLHPPGVFEHNAITLGNHCFFPVNLPENLLPPGDRMSFKHDWLIHELTHAWQYQHVGWQYIVKALVAQFREKEKAYDFEGENGLLKSRKKGKLFKQFNPEQQGNITQSYYDRKRRGLDVSAWEPYIDEIRIK